MRKVPQWKFDIYALALPRGHGFGERPPVAAWAGNYGRGCVIVIRNAVSGGFGFILMRRRVDSAWTVTRQAEGFRSIDAAADALEPNLADGYPSGEGRLAGGVRL